MTRLSMILILAIFGMLLAQGGWADCGHPPLHLGKSSPCALFYVQGEDFQSVTVSGAGASVDWYLIEGLYGHQIGSGTSATVTKAFMEANDMPTGVYPMGFFYWEDEYIYHQDIIGFHPMWTAGAIQAPTSVNASAKTVSYSCYLNTLYESVSYYTFARNGSSAGGGSFTRPDPIPQNWSGSFDIAFSQRGPYGIAFEGIPEHTCPPDYCVCVYQHHVDGAIETPTFGIDRITSSTSSSTQYASPIEPAYGDNVTFHWRKSYNEFHAQSILIMQEDPSGAIVDPNDPNLKYKIIATASLSDSTNVAEHDQGTSSWNTTGDLTWPTPGTNLPEFPSGHHRLGIKYDDEYVELTNQYIDVYLSIYDVYTDSNAPFYVGIDTEDKTSIYYTMSAPAQQGKVNINIGGVKTVEGTPNKGQNVLPNAWDGTTSPNNYVNGGSYELTFNVTPLSGSVGPLLYVSNLSHDSSFIPELGQTLTLEFNINEPVRRPQATQAKITASVYDSHGAFVKLLANEASGNINNQADHTDGHNTLVWDGKDEQGHRVSAGTYTITIVAEDNAGVGCESNCAVTTVDVQTQPHVQTEITLEWPMDVHSLAQGATLPGTPGYTDSYSTVFYSIDGGNEQSVEPGYDGLFYIEPPQIPGMHTVTLRTDNAQFPEKIITASYFVNQFSITGMTPGSRHNTESGSVPVVVDSQAADTIDVFILDSFDQSACIDPQNPVPVADMLNGLVSTKALRTLATGLAVSAGSNTVNWDGKDDAGQFVPPGIYDILVRRQDSDQLLSAETSMQIVVDRPTGAPQISNVVTNVQGACVSVSWNTNVATTGSVLFESEGNAVGKVRSETASTSHTVWLPRIEPGKEYNFYILASNPSTGSTAVSERQTFSTNQGIRFGTVSADIVSPTEATISCTLAPAGAAAVEYAQVGPNMGIPQWMRAEHTFTDTQHVFNLTGLQSNSEYVYRITGSENQQWTDCTKSAFLSFVTKTTLPSLEFVDVDNGQTVQSISQITVRATDVSSARFSSHGITKIELFIDGEQVTSYAKVPSTGHIDYVFDASSLNIGDGLHELEAIAYDDFWKSTLGSIRLLVDSQSLQSMAMAAAVVTASGSSGSSVSKEKRKAQAQTFTVELVNENSAGSPFNHAFLWINDRPKIIVGFYPQFRKRYLWKDDLPNLYGKKGEVVDDTYSCQEAIGCQYFNAARITRKELAELKKAIDADRANPPYYSFTPTVPKTHNCASWTARILKKSSVDPGVKVLVHVSPITEYHMCTKYCYQWVEYWPFLPSDMDDYASFVRAERKKKGKPDL